ncbi:MAG: Ltp family lipoprotein, partial [Olsenella sp.]
IEQLEFDQYSHEDAVYGADNCGADWNEQAAKKAKEYLSFTSFSRNGLIDQLEFEGFTSEQAEYGVNAVGL